MLGGRKHISYHTIQEVFDYIDASPTNGQKIKFRGHKIHMRSTRMLSFRHNGTVCAQCGRQGAYFAKERYSDEPPHLNLYGFNKCGGALLFTRDHIKPKAKGGTNDLYNAQTMCTECNSKKADNWTLRIKIYYYIKKLKFKLKSPLPSNKKKLTFWRILLYEFTWPWKKKQRKK